MRKTARLKDGTEVTIRSMRKDDLEKSLAFFRALPEEDRRYLRLDVTKRRIVRRRIEAMKSGSVKRRVAISKGNIVGDGSLELETREWKEHIGELRLIIARPFQRKGLGTVLASELFWLAARENVEEIVVKMMKPQVSARNIFKRLGFTEDATFEGYVRDLSGLKQDLIVMRCDLKSAMRELEDYMVDSDWQRSR